MSKQINLIYKLRDTSILTPHNLVDNIHLDNYKSINYTKDGDKIICEMTSIEDDRLVNYYYQFDNNNYLQCAYIIDGNEKYEIFNREKELDLAIKNYDSEKLKKVI